MKNKIGQILKSELPIKDFGNYFFIENHSVELSAVVFEFIPTKIIFPVREGEYIDDLSKFEIGDCYSLTYPGTASMKNVVVYQDDLNLFIGGMPAYEYTRIELTRLNEIYFRLSFISHDHAYQIIPFKNSWREAADIYKNIHQTDGLMMEKSKPKFFLQIGVKNAHGDVHIRHFNELIPVVNRFHELFGTDNIVHLYGTNWAGFDRMFPDYGMDPALGGDEAIKNLLAHIHDLGLQSSHHYNPRIADVNWMEKNPSYRNAIVQQNGEYVLEPYASAPHYVMNPNEPHWFKRCFETVEYLSSLGFDFLEIDQITYQRNFYIKGSSLIRGYKNMADRFISMGQKFWLEGVSDVFKLAPGNFYQILIRDRAQRWENGENRRGYPFGRSYAEFFMYIYPHAEVSHQVFTENKKFNKVIERYGMAKKIKATVYDLELGFYEPGYKENLEKVAELIAEYENESSYSSL